MPSNTNEKIEPCPFCGTISELRKRGSWNIVECRNDWCAATTQGFSSKNDAIKAWNKRVLPTQPHELSGNSGELKQTKETPSELIKAIEDWQKDCRPMTPEEREVTNKFFWSHFKETPSDENNYKIMYENIKRSWDGLVNLGCSLNKEVIELKSQLEDYRKALESVRENKWRLYFDWDDTCWRCNEWKGLTPLSAIQSAMSKEGESRNE